MENRGEKAKVESVETESANEKMKNKKGKEVLWVPSSF